MAKISVLSAAAALLFLASCGDFNTSDTARSAAVGAVVGASTAAITDRDLVEGAVAGAVTGAVVENVK